MKHYIELNAVYENGLIRLLEQFIDEPDHSIEIKVLIPVEKNTGISVRQFQEKGSLCHIGGDAVKETEELYHD